MKNLRNPQDTEQPVLFNDEDLGWWASRLNPSALKHLQNGWQGIFRRSLLKLMPAERVGEKFSPDLGRPSKELYSVIGLILIAEMRHLTGEQAAEAYTFDAGVQFALNLSRDAQYLSARSVDNYRRLLREDDHAREIFQNISATLVRELDLDIRRQRLDSTHVLSHMARLGRQQLLATGVRRFLKALVGKHPAEHAAVDPALLERYARAESRLFGQGTKNPQPRAEVLAQLGEDMGALITRFAGHADISASTPYQNLRRLFDEHFEMPPDKTAPIRLRPKSKDAQGGSVNTLQNTSDSGAGYDGHKGAGYQAQIAQSLPPVDDQGRREGPGIITAVLPQSAGVRDSEVVEEVIEQQHQSGMRADEMVADTLYGSDTNIIKAAELGVSLISPVGGTVPDKENPRHNMGKAEREKKARLKRRREEEQSEQWQEKYARRSGIEGLHRALDATTSFKQLRVRGIKAVSMALYLKAAGWNMLAAAKISKRRAIQEARRALGKAIGVLQRFIARITQRDLSMEWAGHRPQPWRGHTTASRAAGGLLAA